MSSIVVVYEKIVTKSIPPVTRPAEDLCNWISAVNKAQSIESDAFESETIRTFSSFSGDSTDHLSSNASFIETDSGVMNAEDRSYEPSDDDSSFNPPSETLSTSSGGSFISSVSNTAAGRLILKAKFGRVRPLSRVIQPSFGMRTRYAYLEISV